MVARGTLTQTSALQEACFSDGLLAVPDVSATTLRYACASLFPPPHFSPWQRCAFSEIIPRPIPFGAVCKHFEKSSWHDEKRLHAKHCMRERQPPPTSTGPPTNPCC